MKKKEPGGDKRGKEGERGQGQVAKRKEKRKEKKDGLNGRVDSIGEME